MNKKQLPVLATIAVVIFLGACYFFIYIPNNEKALQEHRFRILQNVDNNIQSKVESSSILLKNLVDNYGKDDSTKIIEEYIKKFSVLSRDKFTLSDVDSISNNFPVDSGLLNSKINITEIRKKSESSKFLRINMGYDAKQLFEPLLPAGSTFDEYIIINKDKVVYETLPSGLKIINLDTLLNSKSGFSSSGIKNSKIGGVNYKIFFQPVKIGNNAD